MWQQGEVLFRSGGGSWEVPDSDRYTSEAKLQEVVAHQPGLLPFVTQGVVAVREFSTTAGALDVCAVDPSGGITLVECKLASNPEIRRKIVGQILDYASHIWRMSYEEFDANWRVRNSNVGVVECLGLGGVDASELRSTITSALSEGRFNLILAVDRINEALRHVVEYLNEHTAPNTAVVAVEFKYYERGSVEVLVPSVYGMELVEAKPGRSRAKWSVDDFIGYIEQNTAEFAGTARTLLEGLEELGLEIQGTAAQTPSLITHAAYNGQDIWPVALYTSKTLRIQINFNWLAPIAAEAKAGFARKLARIPGCGIDPEVLAASDYKKQPMILIETLNSSDGSTEAFLGALAELVVQDAG
jgi:hypothetical protein